MRKIFTLLPLTAALLLTGCVSLAPDYERPQAPVEEAWPQDEAVKNAKLLTEGLADWASFFTDARLKKLIEQGLAPEPLAEIGLLQCGRGARSVRCVAGGTLPVCGGRCR